MPVVMLGASATPHVPSLHLRSVVSGRRKAPRCLLFQAFPAKLRWTSILELQVNHGFRLWAPEERRSQVMRTQSGSADKTDKVTTEEQKVSDIKNSVAETEESGPPVLTIVAGIFVAVLVFWGIWSCISSITSLFFR